VSIMEAISYGIPALATAVYGNPEIVIDGQNGYLLDINFSVPELVSKLNSCMNDEAKLREMGKNSYTLFREKFDADKNYTLFADYLRSL